MTEFHIGQAVRFRPDAAVSALAMRSGAVVTGYETDVLSAEPPEADEIVAEEDREANERDYVVVRVKADPPFEQWVLPREIEPEGRMQ